MQGKLGYILAAIGALALLLLGGYAGQWWAGRQAPDVSAKTAVQTDTTDAERPPAQEDTATTTASGADADVARASTPREVVRYETVTDTVRDCYSRPSGFDVQGLTTRRPVRIEPDGVFSGPSVTLTTFDPRASRFEQRMYEIPQPQWELWPDVGAEVGPLQHSAEARLSLRWRRVHVWGGYRLAQSHETGAVRRGIAAGIRLRPFTLDW